MTGPDAPVVPATPDFRIDAPLLGGESEVLVAFLEFQRGTLVRKVAGLTPQQLCLQPIAPSVLSPLGIVRHLTEVERYWLREVLLAEDLPDLYCSLADRDGDFRGGEPDTAAFDVAAWITAVERARADVAEWPDPGAAVRGRPGGKQVRLRWVLVHLIEEYARHLGHLDLLREAIDGSTGI